MKRSDGRFLTTHVGSIPRPASLLEKAAAAREDRGTKTRFEDELTSQVGWVVKSQVEAGLDVVNDGEYGKASWSNYILARISGFEIRPDDLRPHDYLGRDRERFRAFFESRGTRLSSPAEVCVGPITYQDRNDIDRDLANLAKAARDPAVADLDTEFFFTSVAPASTAYQGVNEYYPTDEAYMYAIADALREEYRAVLDAGFILQVDDAVLANMYDYYVEQGEDVYQRWAQLRVEALNYALKGFPEDRIRYHICYGSWHVPHVADAPLEAILPFLFQVKAGAYSIEAANPRHEHEWELFESTKLPEGRILIPGVVTHHTTTVEHPGLVAQRLERWARLVGRGNVIAGTYCGFAQGQAVQRVHPEVMWAKYRSLTEGARLASGRVFG